MVDIETAAEAFQIIASHNGRALVVVQQQQGLKLRFELHHHLELVADYCRAKIARGARDSNYATGLMSRVKGLTSPPTMTMNAVLLATFLSFTSLRYVQSFSAMLPSLSDSVPKPSRSGFYRSRMFLNRTILPSEPLFSNIGTPGRRRPRQRPAEILRATEEVEDFDVDMEIDTAKLDVFGTIITQVKMEGRVPASTHLVYDCSHGEWLLAQIAYDRNIRLFSSRSIQKLGSISSTLPDNSRFIFSGALIEKQVKRILKMKGLTAVVANDAKGAIALNEAMNTERDRLAAKKLSKVSQSRERFLLEKGRGRDRARTKEPPTETLASKLRVFIRMQEGQSIEQLTDIIDTIKRVCANLDVVGLWGSTNSSNMNADMCLNTLEAVRTKSKMAQLKLALDHKGPSSSEWYKELPGPRRGPIMWTFSYDL